MSLWVRASAHPTCVRDQGGARVQGAPRVSPRAGVTRAARSARGRKMGSPDAGHEANVGACHQPPHSGEVSLQGPMRTDMGDSTEFDRGGGMRLSIASLLAEVCVQA